MIKLSSLMLAAATSLLVTACATPGGQAASPLPQGKWSGPDGLTLMILDGQLYATTPCIKFGGPVGMQDGRLVTGSLMRTELGCQTHEAAAENALVGFFESSPAILRSGQNAMTLSSGTASMSFTRAPM